VSALELTPSQSAFFKSIKAGFITWKTNVLCCLPQSIRKQLGPDDTYQLALTPHHAHLIRCLPEKEQVVAELASLDPRLLVNLLQSQKIKNQKIDFILLGHQVLTRKQQFPLAIKDTLKQALIFELDRLTPFKAEEVWFGYHIVEQQESQQKLLVELAVVPKASIEPLIEAVKTAGFTVNSVRADHTWESLNLLPKIYRPKINFKAIFITTLLSVTLIALITTTLLLPLVNKREAAVATIHKLDQLKLQSEEVLNLREQLEQRQKDAHFVSTLKQSYIPSTMVLNELTRLLPDDTWLRNFKFRNKSLEIKGESDQASALIGLLESSPHFQGVSFISPVVQTRSAERFSIRLKVVNVTKGN